MTSVLPTDAPEFTPEWFTEVLAPTIPGVRVAAVEVLGRSAATNLHLRLGRRVRGPGGCAGLGVRQAAAARCRPPGGDRGHRNGHPRGPLLRRGRAAAEDAGADLLLRGVGGRRFVRARPRRPRRTAAAASPTAAGPCPASSPAAALEELAEMHVRFEDAAVRNEIAPWAGEQRMKATDFTTRMLRQVIDEHHDILSADYVAVGEIYIERHAELEALWDQGPQTLIHGDTHVGNLFIDDGAGRVPRLGPDDGQLADPRRQLLPHRGVRPRRTGGAAARAPAAVPRRAPQSRRGEDRAGRRPGSPTACRARRTP